MTQRRCFKLPEFHFLTCKVGEEHLPSFRAGDCEDEIKIVFLKLNAWHGGTLWDVTLTLSNPALVEAWNPFLQFLFRTLWFC